MALLFTPIQIGKLALPNRIFMAPMTRSRANAEAIPEEIVATYYTQRASAGLIISEGVFPCLSGKGYVRTPGIVNSEQVAGWKRVTDAVHAKGGHIFMQVMHCGRISHPDMQPGNGLPIAPSAVSPDGELWTDSGLQEFVSPREATVEEIQEIIEAYGRSAALALEAGFDGVELHGAAGYLPEQFLSTGSNRRDDRYGGPIENRSRFMLEVLASMVAAVGGERVGLKISPEMNFNSITDANPVETYTYLVDHLAPFELAYLHVALFGEPSKDYHSLLRPRFGGTYLAGGGLTRETASAMLAEGRADAAVFGTAFIANPDLPDRLRRNAELAVADRSTFYSSGVEGYIDYPALDAALTR
jgi:N-ethylmaleimide reductase